MAPHLGAEITIESDLPVGKGFASSSADLVATSRAMASALRRDLGEEQLLSRLRDIEPTDGVMYPAFVAFFHRRVALLRSLGLPPRPMGVLCVDQGGEIDTIEFNKRPRDFPDFERLLYERLLLQAEAAFHDHDLASLGDVATQSALLHQRRLPKPHLTTFLRLRDEVSALGVAITHSGPCLGLLLELEDEDGLRWATQSLEAKGLSPRTYRSLCTADIPSVLTAAMADAQGGEILGVGVDGVGAALS